MAEAILKARKLEGVDAKSAGIYGADGADMSTNSQKALEKAGVPFAHQAKTVTKSLVDWADLILTMTASHKHALILSFPEAISKIYMFKEFVTPDKIEDVSDPYGGNITIYESTYEELKTLTDELVKKLQEE